MECGVREKKVLDRYDYAREIEREVAIFVSTPLSEIQKKCRKKVRSYLLKFACLEDDASLTLADTIEVIASSGSKKSRRDIAILAVRLHNVEGFFPSQTSGNNIDAKLVHLVEPEFANFYRRFEISESDQTFEKVKKLNILHDYCIEKLQFLLLPSPKIETITAERQSILKAIGDDTVKSYLALFDFQKIRGSIESVLTQVVELSRASDHLFTNKLKDLSDILLEEKEYCKHSPTFVTQYYYEIFLNTVQSAVDEIAIRSRSRFVCEVRSRRGASFSMEKNYPLHAENSIVRLQLPLINDGPGIADQVVTLVNSSEEKVLVENEKIDLGSIPPGDFVVPVTVFIIEPVKSFDLDVIIEWKVIGDPEEKLVELQATVNSQSENTDWDSLAVSNPYGLEIAVGEGFFGRKDKIARLCSRLAKSKMQSSYITGQRRVGKSSLARAVEDAVVDLDDGCFILNIECGDFKHPDGKETVRSLGEYIEQFLVSHLPPNVVWEPKNMIGTLGPLSRLLKILQDTQENRRFVIIIDEFDEINQDLYRHSEIAETLFLNLRSLSGKPNICFILVGAEKMAFVISSQGEKLNKFSKETLDTFSQDSEWEDFEDLVRANVADRLKWHDSAIRALFSETNGHPYFAKQVCAKVYDVCIQNKDAEITYDEVADAISGVISELDVNAFQHFWRDGIQGDLDETEIVSLKRCRVLVAYARSARSNKPTTWENISDDLHSNRMPESEVLPILTDFCRRGIMREVDERYEITINLFERWLLNNGFQSLIADQLGDELAETKQLKEDEAFVRDDEIDAVISSWSGYQGVQVTLQTVRSWLCQIDGNLHQRILFKLLQNLRFFGEAEVRTMLSDVHERLKSSLPEYVVRAKSQRRKDLWVTYLDGPGKSGSNIARLYADANLISTTCVKEMAEVDREFSSENGAPDDVKTLLVVDDFVGSGDSLSVAIGEFYERNGREMIKKDIQVVIVAVCATSDGEERIRDVIHSLDRGADLVVCESLQNRHYAFPNGNGFWEDSDQKQVAKEEIEKIGRAIDKKRPLGYGQKGLLVVFSRNCPNNTLPLLHSSSRGDLDWQPLFERIKH